MPKKEYSYVRKGFRFDGVHYVVTGKTEEEAIKKKIEKLAALEAGRMDSSKTVREWAEAWYDNYVALRKITAKSKAMYRGILDREIIPAVGALKLGKVTPLRLQQLINTHAGESESQVVKIRMVTKALFRRAYLLRLIPSDPSEGLELPETTETGHRSLTDAERAALIAVANYPRFDGKPNRSGCWIMLLLRCGLRPGETAALKKSAVDLKARAIRVTEARESGGKREKGTKTASGVRTVPIPEDLVPWLEAQLKTDPSPWLFTQKDKKSPLTEDSIRARWQTVKKYMDIELGAKTERVKLPGARRRSLLITESVIAEDLDLYDLRHTYCTDLERAGVPINVAKMLMGHKDIATTANIYTHASTESAETARALLNKLVKNEVKKEK
jgi:integrase